MNLWEEEKAESNGFYGSSAPANAPEASSPVDSYGGTDAGQMMATDVQNHSHTGPKLNQQELAMMQDRINQLVADGRDPSDIPGQFPGVDHNLVTQMVERAQTQQDFNPFDNMPGSKQQAPDQQQQGQGFFGGMFVGLAGASAAMSNALGSAGSMITGITSRLFDRPDPAITDMRDFGRGTANFDSMLAEGNSQYVVTGMGKQRAQGIEIT
jgi:hypothetical protein